MRLDRFNNHGFNRGASRLFEVLWHLLGSPIVRSLWMPSSHIRCAVLRAFGARIGSGVCIKPGVRIKFPWKLEVGSHCWIGESVWIDNLDRVTLADHCCLSQAAYLCTGSHDWTAPAFDLITAPIRIESHAWISAHAVVGPGVTVGEGAVLTLGAIATSDLERWRIHTGNPAVAGKSRTERADTGAGSA